MLCEKLGFLICEVRIPDKFISRLTVQLKQYTEAKDDGSEQGPEGLLVKEC